MPTTTGIATEFIQFSRTSNATVTDSDGKIKWAPHNFLLASEQFDSASWAKTTTTVAANSIAAPNGTTTADTLTAAGANSTTLQSYTALAVPYTFGVWLRRKTGTGTIEIAADNGTYTAVTITSSWALYTVSQTPVAGTISAGIRIVTSADEVYAWGAHLYRTDLNMQNNTSAYPTYNPTTPKNFLGFTETISNAAWVTLFAGATAPTKGTVSGTKPNGLTGTIDTLTIPVVSAGQSSAIYQNAGATFANVPITFSVYARVSSGAATIYLNVEDIGASPSAGNFIASTAKTLDTTWQRISVTGTRTTTVGNSIVVIGFDTRCGAGQTNASSITVELWGAQLSDSASLDPYFPSYSTAPTAAAYYGPRRDFNGSTLACNGLLVEELRSNVLLQTAALENAAWTKVSSDATTKVTSPDGTSSANLVYPTSSTTFVGVRQIIASGGFTSGVYTISVFAKAAGKNVLGIIDFGGAIGVAAYFTLTGSGTATNGIAGYTQSITPVGNGWYRCTITSTSSWSNTNNLYTWIVVCDAVGSGAVTVNGTDGVQMYGTQTELGSFATSYIPVGATTAGATRSVDVAQVSTAAFPYSQTAGSFVVAFQTADPNVGMIGDQTGGSAILYANNTDVLTFNASTAVASANVWTLNTVSKAATAYDATGRAVCLNAGTVATGSGLLQTVTSMDIGRAFLAMSLNGHIRQITYLPRRISNTELQQRTSA